MRIGSSAIDRGAKGSQREAEVERSCHDQGRVTILTSDLSRFTATPDVITGNISVNIHILSPASCLIRHKLPYKVAGCGRAGCNVRWRNVRWHEITSRVSAVNL